ncbi:ADP-ribose pyrophosphatase [Acinetobacter calcoaceticus]|uniref:ADP-ribose pyrophosphatase n=1 Tax=Acinetobacter calcoaceticus TaxID=471 RepID=A0A4R1Y1W0_ACICA|nr:ADP-ribose pyrophosphatase [Acinetobacter calcoaceticus]
MHITQLASFNASDITIEAQEQLYQGFVHVERISLRHRLFQTLSSSANVQDELYTPLISRELIRRKEAAGVLLYDDTQQKFALIEQFRIGAIRDQDSPWQLEIIAGLLDGDESAESCIRRECYEESGCEVDQLEHLFSFYPSAGACDEIFHLYSANVNLPLEGGIFGLAEEGENIKLHLIEYTELNSLLHSGRLCNAAVIMALQWLKQHLLTR